MDGVHRFSDLRRKVGGVSEKMLAQTLKWLEADGFVDRKSYATVPPHVEYRLTPLGRQVGKRVESLADWIEGSLPDIIDARRARSAAAAKREPRPVGVHRL
jgi:DNA-binding HxlR family transcriptional regulator